MKVSFIVPVYKSAKTILQSMTERVNSLTKICIKYNFEWEIIAVIDGQFDESENIIKSIGNPNIKILSYKNNNGKGFAIKTGMQVATGDLIGFIDDGLNFDTKVIEYLVSALANDEFTYIAVGSKLHNNSKLVYPLTRKLFTKGYALLAYLSTGIKYKDTQVGAKLFRKIVVDKFLPKIMVKRFAIDIEMLAIATKFKFEKHIDVPVSINFEIDKSTLKSIFNMALDTIAVGYRLRILKHYDDKSKSDITLSSDVINIEE